MNKNIKHKINSYLSLGVMLLLTALAGNIYGQATVEELIDKSNFEKNHFKKSQKDTVTIRNVITNKSARITLRNWERKIQLIGLELPKPKDIMSYFDRGLMPNDERDKYKLLYSRAFGAFKNHVTSGDVLYIEQDIRKKDTFGNLLVYLYAPNRRIINVELVKSGLAYPVKDIDNKLYEKEMFKALEYAIDHKLGLYKIWQLRSKESSIISRPKTTIKIKPKVKGHLQKNK